MAKKIVCDVCGNDYAVSTQRIWISSRKLHDLPLDPPLQFKFKEIIVDAQTVPATRAINSESADLCNRCWGLFFKSVGTSMLEHEDKIQREIADEKEEEVVHGD